MEEKNELRVVSSNNELATRSNKNGYVPAKRGTTPGQEELNFLDDLQHAAGELKIVQSGELAGKTVEEARVLKQHLMPKELMHLDKDKNGVIDQKRRQLNELMLSFNPEDTRPREFFEFPNSIKGRFVQTLEFLGIVFIVLVATWALLYQSLNGAILLFGCFLLLSSCVGISLYWHYLIFKNRDYLAFKGIVTNIVAPGKFAHALSLLSGYEKKVEITMTLVNGGRYDGEFISFLYPMRLLKYGNKKFAIQNIKENSPITVYTTKWTKIKNGMFDSVIGVEFGETSDFARSEFGEEITAGDFARRMAAQENMEDYK